MNATQKATMYAAIEQHGRRLLAIFPKTEERDPVKLCKVLRRQEVRLSHASEAYCNDETSEEDFDQAKNRAIWNVSGILQTTRVWINSDPRGYALKIDLAPGEELHRDWGGYGIIAPDFTPAEGE